MPRLPNIRKRVQRLLPFLIILVAVGLRLINPEADFPLNITWSGVIYTHWSTSTG